MIKDSRNLGLLILNVGCGEQYCEWMVNCDRYSPKVDIRCDAKDLPFKDGTFDVLHCIHVVEHFDFQEAFDVLREWKRVLKSGGKLVIETPNFKRLCERFLELDERAYPAFYGMFFAYPWVPGQLHKFLYTENQLRWTLETVGFTKVETREAIRYKGLEDVCLGMVGTK